MVYVDPLFGYGGSATFKWKESCHMWADTEEELHKFATSIGLKRAWFQQPPEHKRIRLPHYDLNKSRRIIAVRKGAVELLFEDARECWKRLGFIRD